MVAYVGHGDDDYVFLIIELAGSQVEFAAEDIPFAVGHHKIPSKTDRI